jgi:potassium/chloride transporter 4/5/6
MLISKGEAFPDMSARLTGNIDIWWIVADGGILLLLSHLLMKHPVWSRCHTRLFAVADHASDDPEQVKIELESYVKDFRLNIEVHVKVIDPSIDIELREQAQEQLQRDAEHMSRQVSKESDDPVTLADVVPQIAESKLSPRSYVYPLDDLISGAVEYPKDIPLQSDQQGLERQTSKDSDSFPKKIESKASFGSGVAKWRTAPERQASDKGKPFPNAPPSSIGEQAAKELRPPSNPLALPSKMDSKGLPSKMDPKAAASRDVMFVHSGEQLNSNKALSVEELILAKGLNKLMVQESKEAELVITNLPDMPPGESALGYCQLVDSMTEGLKRCFLLRGTASEVITAFT